MNEKTAKALRRQARANMGLTPTLYSLDTRKYKAVPRAGMYLEPWQHGPVRGPHVIFTRVCSAGTTRESYRYFKRIYK